MYRLANLALEGVGHMLFQVMLFKVVEECLLTF